MKSRNLIYLCLILCAFIDNINAKEKELDNSLQAQSMLSVLYAQSSAEYEASNIQTYVNAKSALDRALNDLGWTAAIEQKENFKNKPPAIILDIDETVLNNIPFQARAIINGQSYPTGWLEWLRVHLAPSLRKSRDQDLPPSSYAPDRDPRSLDRQRDVI